jgi:hypothetical protein
MDKNSLTIVSSHRLSDVFVILKALLLCAVTVLVVHSFAVAPLATTGFFQLPW